MDLEAGQLDNRSLMTLAKFTRTLLAHSGIVLQLCDPSVLKKVDQFAQSSNDKDLSVLHAKLKVALKHYVDTPAFKQKLPMILFKRRQRDRLEHI